MRTRFGLPSHFAAAPALCRVGAPRLRREFRPMFSSSSPSAPPALLGGVMRFRFLQVIVQRLHAVDGWVWTLLAGELHEPFVIDGPVGLARDLAKRVAGGDTFSEKRSRALEQ